LFKVARDDEYIRNDAVSQMSAAGEAFLTLLSSDSIHLATSFLFHTVTHTVTQPTCRFVLLMLYHTVDNVSE